MNNEPLANSQQQAPMAPLANPAPQPNASGPFEMPQPSNNPNPPMGGQSAPGGFQPVETPPSGGSKTWILILLLVIILIAGGLVFASWEGWISLGGIEKYWTKTDTTTTVSETTDTETTTSDSATNPNDKIRKQDLANLATALKKYYTANKKYPVAEVEIKTSDPGNVLEVLVANDIAKIPVDPLSPTKYYGYKSNGTTFEISAVLEDTTDPAGIKVGNIVIYKITDTTMTDTTTTESSSTTTTTENPPAMPTN